MKKNIDGLPWAEASLAVQAGAEILPFVPVRFAAFSTACDVDDSDLRVQMQEGDLYKEARTDEDKRFVHGQPNTGNCELESSLMKKWLLIFCLLLSACNKTTSTEDVKMSQQKVIQVRMGAPIEEFISGSPVKFDHDCLPQAEFCFHEFDRSFGAADLPSVVVDSTLLLPHVANLSIFENKPISTDVENLSLMIRSLPSNSPHEEYREFIYNLIGELQRAGWRHYYKHYRPRIPGNEYLHVAPPAKLFDVYVTADLLYDPNYRMTMDEWNQTNGFYNWNFFKDGVYLSLDAWRNNSIKAPKERGTYLVSLEFQTEDTYWRYSFSKETEHERWRELLPGLLAGYAQKRKALEDKARAEGIKIDTSYQDPPIKALQSR